MFRHKNKLTLVQIICGILYLTVPICWSDNEHEHQEEKLFKKLFNSTVIKFPHSDSYDYRKPVVVDFGFNLINIVEVNAKKQFITVYGWVMQTWYNHHLKWNPADYNGLETLHVSSDKIWVPDILLFNNLDEQDRVGGGPSTYKTQVVINSDGKNVWNSPAMFKSFCRIQVRYFPLDNQTCMLTFGSWTHDNRTLDLHPMHIQFPTKSYTKNGEWTVFNIVFSRDELLHACCKNPYAVLNFTIHINREAFDYLITLIIPCCLISSMIFLGFILPPETGERIGLSITVLLAMTVFQQLTSAIMPAYDFPILGQYYFAIVLEISASLVVTTLILNFYHRTHRKMPFWIRKLLIHWLSRLVLLHGEVSEKYSSNQCSPSNAIRMIHKNQFNETNRNRAKGSGRKRNDTISETPGSGYDCCYGDNIFGNEQVMDTEGIEMSGLPQVKSYPFSMAELDNSEKKRNEDQDISDKEREMRHWEWTISARILDRCVLIVAILLGIITVAAVFFRAPSLWKDFRELSAHNPINITRYSHIHEN